MSHPIALLGLLVIGTGWLFSAWQLWIVLYLGGIPLRGDKGLLRKEDRPFTYWAIVAFCVAGLVVGVVGQIVIAQRALS